MCKITVRQKLTCCWRIWLNCICCLRVLLPSAFSIPFCMPPGPGPWAGGFALPMLSDRPHDAPDDMSSSGRLFSRSNMSMFDNTSAHKPKFQKSTVKRSNHEWNEWWWSITHSFALICPISDCWKNLTSKCVNVVFAFVKKFGCEIMKYAGKLSILEWELKKHTNYLYIWHEECLKVLKCQHLWT